MGLDFSTIFRHDINSGGFSALLLPILNSYS